MWIYPKRSPPILLLLIATTARRANATLGCSGNFGWLQDTANTCRAGDFQRVFGGNLLKCTSTGLVSIIDGLGCSLTFTSHRSPLMIKI